MEVAPCIMGEWCKMRLPGTLCTIYEMLGFILQCGEGCDGLNSGCHRRDAFGNITSLGAVWRVD